MTSQPTPNQPKPQKQTAKAVIIILVGPLGSRNRYAHVVDTVQSVKHYASPDSRILIQDNSSPLNLGKRLQEQFPDLLVSRAPKNYGLYGGLYKSESFAFQYIHDNIDCKAVIMMDSDALFTGHGLEDAAISFFEQKPNVGLIGNYLTAGEGIEWAAQKLTQQIGPGGWVRDRERYTLLRQLVQKARGRGWKDGQHVLGGIAIYNAKLVEKMAMLNLLGREPLRRAFLQVDHIFGLLCAACGMDMAFFNIPSHPFAVVWRGMPIAPDQIVAQGVKAFHSTRSWKDAEREWNEDQIREYFATLRTKVMPFVR
jgi:hypothetical protein